MANYTYNGIELPDLPASNSPVAVISAVLDSASSMFAGASYIVTFGASILWSGSKCYVSNISGVYRYNGSAWVWHYGSGTTYTQDIIASGYFEAVWTNTNIPTADGVSVYLAKSEPVPVGGESGGESGGEEEDTTTPEYTIDDVNEARRRGFIAGFLAGVNIRGALNKKTITERAAYYLYGTPNESGNVALADGDGYTLYDGVVLPKRPEMVYPYEFMRAVWDNFAGELLTVYLYAYSEPIEATPLSSGSFKWELTTTPGAKYVWCYSDSYDGQSNEWKGFYEDVSENGSAGSLGEGSVTNSNLPWCNHNIINSVDGSVSFAASAPIPLKSDEPIRYEGDIPVYEKRE